MKANKLKSKTTSFSETIKTEVICPNDTNPMGILQGGKLVQWMDIAAAVCAQTHSDGICVTVSIGTVRFFRSAKVGNILTIKAKITRAFNTSMEIMVEASVRDIFGNEPQPLSQAYFTFVAIDDKAKKRAIPQIALVSEEDRRNYEFAGLRKENDTAK
ncbi:MAG: acyl-CoA thioesterase [Chitinophagaceae bacterium]|nr:acyl-CoA thioesterase [Chitinophagaceae bacterium]MCW5906034.1 acyl-CoA thioesterase [Chitinophagaceae bacterium]